MQKAILTLSILAGSTLVGYGFFETLRPRSIAYLVTQDGNKLLDKNVEEDKKKWEKLSEKYENSSHKMSDLKGLTEKKSEALISKCEEILSLMSNNLTSEQIKARKLESINWCTHQSKDLISPESIKKTEEDSRSQISGGA